jgi:hypothetical protein
VANDKSPACFDKNNVVRKVLASRHFLAWRGENIELKMQDGALNVELVLSGFFSAQIPPRTAL